MSTGGNIQARLIEGERMATRHAAVANGPQDEVVNMAAMAAYVPAVYFINGFAGSNPAADRYLGLASWGAVYDSMFIIVPETSTMTNLRIAVFNAPGVGETFSFEVYKNGVATGVIVVFAEGETSKSTAVEISFTAGDTFALWHTRTGGAPTVVHTSYKFLPQ